jgi:beta-N-acetylhexosaminidase
VQATVHAASDERPQALLDKMSLPQKVGQMLVVGIPATTAGPVARRLIRQFHVGGVILFRRNVQSSAQVQQLTTDLQRLVPEDTPVPLIVAIDHEGGTNCRLKRDVTPLPTNMALGATRSPGLASEVAHIAANELRAMGVNANLAPVLDVNDNPLNPIIGLRSFGQSPELVTALGSAYIQSLQQNGVIATAKHFPGHGSTATDSHLELPVVRKSRPELEEAELMPFRSAITAGVGMVMTAHVAFPGLDGSEQIPATLSPAVVHHLLRQELGCDGVIISDDMGMKGITAGFSPGESAVRAVQAGVDLVLMAGGSEEQSRMYHALLEAVADGAISEARINTSVARILGLKADLLPEQPGPAPTASIGSQQSVERAAAICERAVTLVKNSDGMLPLCVSSAEKALVISPSVLPRTERGTVLGETIRRRGVSCGEVVIDLGSKASRATALGQARQLGRDASWLLVATWHAEAWQATLVEHLLTLDKPIVVVALGSPYDLAHFPAVGTYLVTYGRAEANVQAAAKVIFGELSPTGALPVSIPGLYEVGHGFGL